MVALLETRCGMEGSKDSVKENEFLSEEATR
jgi:hypothetical protein